MFRSILIQSTSTALMAAVCLSAAAMPVVKLPLDVEAPQDKLAAQTRLVGISPIDRTRGAFATVGPWGKILISRDSGKTWKQSPAPASSDLVAVHFPTPKTGWAVGHDGVVLHSADGGASWEKRLDGRQYGDIMVRYYQDRIAAQGVTPGLQRALEDAQRFKEDGADKPFLDVWFENEQSGWVVGAFNLILKTSDGGKTWEPWIDRTENDNAYTLFAIGPAGNDVFVAGELGLLLRLDRQQKRFVKVDVPYPGTFFGLAGKPGALVVYGLRGNAWLSHDVGKRWRKLDTGLSGGITGGTWLDDGRLLLVNSDGQMIVSSDDGDRFSAVALKRPMPLNTVAQTSGNQIIVIGERGVGLETIAGGSGKR